MKNRASWNLLVKINTSMYCPNISTLLNQSLATSKLFLKTRLQGGSFRNSFAVDSRVLRKLIKLKGLAKEIPKENEKRELCKVTYFK